MKHYLATTGISEIWDLDASLYLLGPWCLKNEENTRLAAKIGYHVVPSPWGTARDVKEAADYCHDIYEELLPQMAEYLNRIHQVSCPANYWRILTGFWLLHFIEVAYDRYKRVEKACGSASDMYIHALPREKCELRTYDAGDFTYHAAYDDYYNLKLFSIAARKLYPQIIVEKDFNPASRIDPKENVFKSGLKTRVIYNLMRALNLLRKNSIVLSDMYHLNHKDMILLKAALWNKGLTFINFELPARKYPPKDNYSCKLRKALELHGASDGFQTLLYDIIGDAMPSEFIENYKDYKTLVNHAAYMDSIKIVGSAVGWSSNNIFRFFAAEASLRNAYLVEFQHGGCYGMSQAITVETLAFERDVFFTWGWDSDKRDNVRPLPNPHLSRLKDTRFAGIDNILFVGVTVPRYQHRFHTIALCDDMPRYFEDKEIFFRSLTDRIRNRILYRPYPEECGWNEMDRVKKMYPDVKFALQGNLVNWLQKVKLVVIDHPHTSFIEALTVNVPCILYWDHQVYLMKDEAGPYFKLLADAGILFKNPESAAKKVEEIFDNPEEWWLTKDVQDARVKFCGRFAYARKDWMKIWAEEFKNLLSKRNSRI